MADELVAGVHAAFADVYVSTVQAVYSRCRGRVGGHDAEDAVSVVFLEVWRLREKAVAVEGSALPWVLAVTDHCLADYSRSRRRHEARLARYRASGDVAGAAPDHAEAVAADLDAQSGAALVVSEVARLPEPQQTIARRCLLEHATSVQVADELGCSPSTVRGHLGKARARIASAVRRSGDDADTRAVAGHLPIRRPHGAGAPLVEVHP
ncbi:RNA polymerase sigma factor [Pseudokineococcus sp. 1T1Z-3]|uniref:RNA polymerase sigma factor n=1 Tax=Pseudokineococcus sp. 1T1Z-3 TaxID=3132745 RepID=UPI0030AD8B4D